MNAGYFFSNYFTVDYFTDQFFTSFGSEGELVLTLSGNSYLDAYVYKNQKLKLQLDTNEDLSNAGDMYIKYKKPSGLTATVSATVEDDENGLISYTFSNDVLDESGLWRFKAYNDISQLKGVNYKLYINEEYEQ